MTAGRFTLPAAIFITLVLWTVAAFLLPAQLLPASQGCLLQDLFQIPTWLSRLLSIVIYGGMGYFLVGLNNMFGIIRMRASVQTTAYFLLISICPVLHLLQPGDVVSVAVLAAFFFLFRSYQQSYSVGNMFHAFACIGIGTLIVPQLMLLMPMFWIAAYRFQALHVKSFFASLLGWILPYWFLLGYAYCSGQIELFYLPFRELVDFQPITFNHQPWEWATFGYLFIVFAVSAIHCLVTGYEDKIRTRAYLNFLIQFCFILFLFILLQPSWFTLLLPTLLIGISILAGHLFVLSHSRLSNIFFIFAMAGLFALFAFNVWTLLWTV